MFEDKLIVPDSLCNISSGDGITGFRFDFRLPADRGMWLSLIGGFYLAVDGCVCPESSQTLVLNGVRYPAASLSSQTDVHWDAYRPAGLEVFCPGGLAPGSHEVDFQVVTLTGYFKAKEEWVMNPPKPGAAGARRFILSCR